MQYVGRMANTESSFADRYGRALTLAGSIAEFTPAFAPPDTSLTPTNFAAFLESIEAANRTLADRREDLSNAVAERQAMAKTIKTLCQRAMTYVTSNPAWSKHASTIKLTYTRLRGYRPGRAKAPTQGDEAEVRKFKVTQRSFAELDDLFTRFITALDKVPGYAPPAPELTITQLQATDTAFETINKAIADLAPEVALLVRNRASLYESLREKARGIKAAVLAQYGPTSPEYDTIKRLRF